MMRYIHFSVDDVIGWLEELDDYSTLFHHPRFQFLKSIHERYGAVVTLELFYRKEGFNLSYVTPRFKDEFEKNSNWLRMAFHGYDSQSNYFEIPSIQAKEHYQLVTNAIMTFASQSNIDSIPRTHFFSGTLENVRIWYDSSPRVHGFLTSDDEREHMLYLNKEQRQSLHDTAYYFDQTEQLHFVKSQPRLENWTNPVHDLNNLNKLMTRLAFFTHEQNWSPAIETKIEALCEWGITKGYRFAFPMDVEN